MSDSGIQPNKPFKSFDDQLDYLENHYKLYIEDKELAKNVLKTISYYDLINGYKELFVKDSIFVKEVTFNTIYALSNLDKSFQAILLKFSVYVERKFKNILAHIIAREFTVFEKQYLLESNYEKPIETKRIRKFYQTFQNIRDIYESNSVEMPTAHYLKKHNHIPPWILFKNVSFSSVIDLAFYLPKELKLELAKECIAAPIRDDYLLDFMSSSLRLVRMFRNVIAHNSKFINFNTGRTEIIVKNVSHCYHHFTNNQLGWRCRGNDRYSMFLCLIILLHEPTVLLNIYQDFYTLVEKYSIDDNNLKLLNQYLDLIGFPKDFIHRFEMHLKKHVAF